MGRQLTKEESKHLAQLEEVIDKSLTTFIEVGTALLEIRESQLYLGTHETFERYCKDRFAIGKSHAHRFMQATEIVNNIGQELSGTSPTGTLPERETQVRPLAQLPENEQAKAWKEAVATAPNGQVTEEHVKKIVQTRAERLGLNVASVKPRQFQEFAPAYRAEQEQAPKKNLLCAECERDGAKEDCKRCERSRKNWNNWQRIKSKYECTNALVPFFKKAEKAAIAIKRVLAAADLLEGFDKSTAGKLKSLANAVVIPVKACGCNPDADCSTCKTKGWLSQEEMESRDGE